MSLLARLAPVACLALAASAASAAPIVITVGDDDGFGAGIANGATTEAFSTQPVVDNRSGAEALATDGAQLTDLYSAVYPDYGGNAALESVVFPFAGTLLSATLTVEMTDFQSDRFDPLVADINGIALPFFFADGRHVAVTRDFVLTGAQLAAANLAGSVIFTLDRDGATDFVGFDYFRLSGETAGARVPVPPALPLLAGALAGLGLWRRRR